MSAVNVAEAVEILSRKGSIREQTRSEILATGIEPLTQDQAFVAGALLSRYRRSNNLSLGDACCLALGMHLHAEVFTCERRWSTIALPISVRVIR